MALSEYKRRVRFLKKQLLLSLGVSLLTVISLVLLFLSFMEGRFFPGTRINQVDLSLMKRKEAAAYFSDWKQEEFQLTLLDKEGNAKTLTGKDIHLGYEPDFSEVPKLDSFFMLFSLGKEKDYPLKGKLFYDEASLHEFVTKYAEEESTDEAPGKAFLTAYVPGAGYLIGKERSGGKISKEALEKAIQNAITEGKRYIKLEEESVYEEANKVEGLEKLQEEKNNALPGIIRYNFSGEVIELNSDTSLSWFKNGGAELDNGKVKQFVRNLKLYTDTSGSERSFKTEDGRILSLRGKYGFSLSEKKEIKRLTESLLARENIVRDAEYDMVALARGAEDIGNTYVEVDIGRQKIFYFENGVMQFSSDCVTGNIARRHGTPDGVYSLTYKARNATLKGADYEAKVNYWMPFNKGIGFHDALWRNRFGGNIYRNAGSHGCINLPLSGAQVLYQKVYQGIPVVCHF
jgi:hypothetical protein